MYKRQDYFREALVAPHSANWVNYDGEDSIRISRVLYDYDSYEILGLLIISLSTEYLLDKFSTYNTIEVEHLYMINKAGVIPVSYTPLDVYKRQIYSCA